MYRPVTQKHVAHALSHSSNALLCSKGAASSLTPTVSRRYYNGKPKPAASSAPRSSPQSKAKTTPAETAKHSPKRRPFVKQLETFRFTPSARENRPASRFAPSAASKNKSATSKDDYKPPARHYSRNTLHENLGKKPTPTSLNSYTGRQSPGASLRSHKILRGDPQSFPGKKVFCIPGGWNDIADRGSERKFVFCHNLLRGPLEERPKNVKRNWRVNTMTNYVQIVSTPTADTGASLLLHFDHRRYLFGNLSEGTQRAMSQRKLAVAKLETLFMSGETKWENTGGMIGMMLTIADVQDGSRREIQARNEENKKTGKKQVELKGPERIEIHGAQNLNYSIATARGFVFRKGLPIRAVELYEDPRVANPEASTPDWEDDSIQVWKVPISTGELSSALNKSRKRSHEVMTAEDEALQTPARAESTSNEQQRMIDREAVEAIVGDMFNSDWTMDKLYETKLSQVKLPATVFIKENGQIQKYKGPMPGDKGEVPDVDVLVRYPWPAATVESLPEATRSNSAVCYVVKNRGRRGKFNPVVAKELGVNPPDFKYLADGKTVKGKTGNEVTPDMVLGAPTKPIGFAVIDIASTSFIESFLGRSEWKNQTVMDNVPVFYWILGQSVIDDQRIQNFMKERPNVKHVVMAPDTCPNMVSMESYGLLHAKLRRIDHNRFPLLNSDNTVRDLSHIGPNVEAARVGMKAVLGAEFKAKKDEIVPFPTFKEVSGIDNMALKLASDAIAKIRKPDFLEEVERVEQDIPNRDTEVIPLGTGSALPSKYRNVSSTIIRVPQYGNYILDCGENTLGQLRRAYPADEVTKILQETRCIFISHMHADHHLGTASFIRAWSEATAHLNPQPKLGIVSPNAMQYFLMEYNRIEPMAFDRLQFIRKDHVFPHSDGRLPADCPTRLASVQLVPVQHCQHSYAGVLTWPSGLKIAYSGDCRPSDKLVEAGKGATLLIHESTFDDDKKGDALAKKHSTMSEALDVAYRMGARRVLLTHFSQRYAKLPLVEKRTTETGADQAVLMAFDQMRVKLGEFRQAQAFLPAIRRMLDTEASKADDDD